MAKADLRAESARDNTAQSSVHTPRGDAGAFDGMLADYLAAKAEYEIAPADVEEAEDDRLYRQMTASELAVMRRPAPNLEAVLAKLEIGTRNTDLQPEDADFILSDLRRLGGVQYSPTFQPAVWLKYFTRYNGRATLTMIDGVGAPCLVVPICGDTDEMSRALERVCELQAYEAAAISDYLVQTLEADQGEWDRSWALYQPIRQRWLSEYEAVEAMPAGAEKDAAFHAFRAKVEGYQAARDEMMRIAAPSLDALLSKMDTADRTDEEHFNSCADDLRRLLSEARPC